MKIRVHTKGVAGVALVALLFLLSSCGNNQSESPNTFGARAGEDGAKYFKEQNPSLMPSAESAGQYCATMAEEGSKINEWTAEEIIQAADSCAIWFSTEMMR